MKEENEIYSTKDLTLAATLISLKFRMERIDYQIEGDRKVGYFKFHLNDALREAEQQFWQGLVSIEPKNFMTIIRALKAQINNVYKNPHYFEAEKAAAAKKSK